MTYGNRFLTEGLAERRKQTEKIRKKAETWERHGEYLGHTNRVGVHVLNMCLLGWSEEKIKEQVQLAIEKHTAKGNNERARAYELFISAFKGETE